MVWVTWLVSNGFMNESQHEWIEGLKHNPSWLVLTELPSWCVFFFYLFVLVLYFFPPLYHSSGRLTAYASWQNQKKTKKWKKWGKFISFPYIFAPLLRVPLTKCTLVAVLSHKSIQWKTYETHSQKQEIKIKDKKGKIFKNFAEMCLMCHVFFLLHNSNCLMSDTCTIGPCQLTRIVLKLIWCKTLRLSRSLSHLLRPTKKKQQKIYGTFCWGICWLLTKMDFKACCVGNLMLLGFRNSDSSAASTWHCTFAC